MHYPVWYLPEIGGGSLIALIAVFHVFISHFAVGGGLYLVLAERKGLHEHSQAILDFTHRHAKFFLLVTMVLGSISGVGIWFIISLVNPAATSYLIHSFVFGWAAEWVFFTVEIAAAFVYFYLFGKMDWSTHLKVGYLYFFAAWMSLFLINGIIGVMLTPGAWAETGDFWQGFFNPSFWPSLFFRTFVAILLAGCYGCLSAAWSRDEEVRVRMTRFSGLCSLIAFIGAVPAAVWYVLVLPAGPRQLVLGKSPTIVLALEYGTVAVLLLLTITLVATIIRPQFNNRLVALAAMACAFVLLGSFEWVREAARRPYVINEVIYSNSIFKKDADKLTAGGFLESAVWVAHKRLSPDNRVAVGRELFIHQCYSCHTLGGGNNDLAAQTANMSYPALVSYLGKMHILRPFMPPFVGTADEARALASYLIGEMHGKEVQEGGEQAGDGMAAGRQLFEENCAACHGREDVTGAFDGQTKEKAETILLTLNEISSEMASFGGTDLERGLLADFLRLPVALPGAQKVVDGAAVFDMHCASCHGSDDLAGKIVSWDRALIYENLGRLQELAPEMPPFTGSEEERAALAKYLDDLKGGK